VEGGARHLDQVGIGERRYGLAYSSGTPLLDVTARPLSSATDDETQILSVPVQLRRSGREIRMLIDRPDPFAAAKPDARLIKLLVRARLFNAALVSSADISFAALAKREGVSPSYFTRDVSQRTPLWRKTDSNHRSRRQRDGRGEGPAPNHRRRGRRPVFNDPIQIIGPASPFGNSRETLW